VTSLRLPPSDCRELLRLSGIYRAEVEAELARELDHDTEPCPTPDDSPGTGAQLRVDPTALRRKDADRLARLVALANTHDPRLAEAPQSGPAHTTRGELQITIPPRARGHVRLPLHLLTVSEIDEVIERLKADTEPMLSSDRQRPNPTGDDPNDDDDPDDYREGTR
jgi:hypothetical protein